jgi:hypothetical protein
MSGDQPWLGRDMVEVLREFSAATMRGDPVGSPPPMVLDFAAEEIARARAERDFARAEAQCWQRIAQSPSREAFVPAPPAGGTDTDWYYPDTWRSA